MFKRSTRRRRDLRTSLTLQQLEQRHAMAANLSFDGHLTVTGTEGSDRIYLENTGGNVSVWVNGARETIRQELRAPGLPGRTLSVDLASVPAATLRSIRMNGLGGNDNLSAAASPIGVTLDGGGDEDRLVGSPFNDVIFTGDGRFNEARGEDGNDTIYGGRGVDTLLGGRGDDMLAGGGARDVLLGGDGRDTLHGGDGDDALDGGDGNDRLFGDRGDDTLYGGGGADTLSGGDNNDRLYGGSGDDTLDGGRGNDGMFGGTGRNQVIDQRGADRVLTLTRAGVSDEFRFRGPEDAVIPFHDAPSLDAHTTTYRAGSWSDEDVIRVDEALHNLHHHVGNTRLLKKADQTEMTFSAQGLPLVETGVGGWNGGGAITLVNPSGFDQRGLLNTVYHEVGHNWDDPAENPRAEAFRRLSGWRVSETSPGGDFDRLGDMGSWWHRRGAAFATEYGRKNPFEDYATVFEKYFMERYHVGVGGYGHTTPVPRKFANLELLFSDLGRA